MVLCRDIIAYCQCKSAILLRKGRSEEKASWIKSSDQHAVRKPK